MARKELSDVQRAFIYGLYIAGLSKKSISAQTGTPPTTVTRTIQLIERNIRNGAENPYKSAPRAGRPHKLDDRAKRQLVCKVTAERKATLTELVTPSKSGKSLNCKTVQAILKAANKARHRARRKPWISDVNKRKRLIFRRRNKYTPWVLVYWSDKAYFEVGEDGRSVYVTRSPGEEFLPECLQPTFKSGRTKVGVWGCFCGPHRGPIVILP